MRPTLLLATLLSLLPAAVQANPIVMPPAPPPTGPRSVAPQGATNVALVREAHVKGTHWLTNTSEQAEHVKVGFPDISGAETILKRRLANLKVSVAGDKVVYKYDRTERKNNHLLDWFVWEMDFAPGEEHVLVVEYDTTFARDRDPLWAAEPQGVFEYWLHTRADWSGRIREATIKMTVSPEARNRIESVRPSGASWEGNTIMWQFANLSPTAYYDIAIRYGDPEDRLHTFLSIDEITAILQDPSHPKWNPARQAALDLGTRQMTSLLVRTAQRKKAFEQANPPGDK
jgi:hypothetical protein